MGRSFVVRASARLGAQYALKPALQTEARTYSLRPMDRALPATASKLLPVRLLATESNRTLLRQVLLLSMPVLAEHAFHIVVGLTDTYMANHLPKNAPAAASAVGTISYFLWFIGLIISSIGTGATALIAHAKGARHRSLANSVCGQAISAAVLLGITVGVAMYCSNGLLIALTGLEGDAPRLAADYLHMLCWSVPFSTLMFVANSCLRGAGDTLTPALSMIFVDLVNIFFTYSLTRGAFGLPEMGFNGIAVGTVIAYIAGGILLFVVLLAGRGGVRLHLHRLFPHWITLKRLFRIGIPSGVESLLVWIAQFAVLHEINRLDVTNIIPTAHSNAIRIEALSYMAGFAVATAAATMVGQSLGAKNPRRASRCAYLCYAVGGGFMTLCGFLFMFLGPLMARGMSPNPQVIHLTARCLFITGFIQVGFAAAIIFSGALRGAGDTLAVMVLNLVSIFFIRFLGVLFVTRYLHASLTAIWVVLCIELFCRGLLLYARFLQGNWRHIRV